MPTPQEHATPPADPPLRTAGARRWIIILIGLLLAAAGLLLHRSLPVFVGVVIILVANMLFGGG